MYIVKILKRKDAASIVVAIVLALVLLTPINVLTVDLAQYLSGVEEVYNLQWREGLVAPLMQFILQVVLLEAILRAVVWVRPLFVRRVSKSTRK